MSSECTCQFFQVSQENITPLWADYPGRITGRNRGKNIGQINATTAGSTLKIKSLRSVTSELENPLKINQQTINLLKQHTSEEELHELLQKSLGEHI